MIHYLKHTDIDQTKWDACIARSSGANLYGYSWWLTIVCPQWEALVMDDYRFVFPLAVAKKFGLPYLVQPPFTQRFAVYGDAKSIDAALFLSFLKAIPSRFLRLHCRFSVPADMCFPKQYAVEWQKSQVIDLSKPYSELQAQYSNNFWKNDKKSKKYNLSVSSNVSLDQVVVLLKTEMDKKRKLPSAYYSKLHQLFTASAQYFPIKFWGVRDENQDLILASWMLDTGERIYKHYGTTSQAREKGAVFFYIDQLIKQNENQKKVFDFGGSDLEGVYQFNHSFGAEDEKIAYLKMDKFPFTLYGKIFKK
ncbi:MAG: hypothetical protein RSC04_00045 [Bacteroidales bacterium]